MTVDLRPKSAGETLQELAARLYRVEQENSRPGSGAGGSLGSDPSVNTVTIGGIVVGADASPATGLTLATGSFMDDIWIDADWTAPVDGSAGSYDVELARKDGASYELVQVFHTSGTALRMSSLWPETTYGVRVTAINRIDARSDPLPAIGFEDITTGIDATIPDQVTAFSLVAGIRTIMATWVEVDDRDVARGTGTYEVQLATDSDFTAIFASKFTSATVCSFSGVVSATTYWGRVRAVDNSGNAGAWSISTSVTTVQTGTADIADLVVTNAKIAALAVDDAKIADLSADKITAGTLDADRIAANSLDVNKLTTSTLTARTITIGSGGVLKIGNAPTTGILINDQGIRLYSGGSVKVALDVLGTASFEGNIDASTITSSTITSATINAGTITGATVRTASSGKRVALEAGVIDFIRWYTGHAAESAPGRMGVSVSGSTLFSLMDAPRSSNDYGGMSLWSVTGGNGSGAGLYLRNSADAVRASVILGASGNLDTPSLEVVDVDGLYCHFADNADLALRGSGNYSFVYFWGGGLEATINVNVGLGSGIHIMNGTNASFTPVQASAFNIASSQLIKRNVTDAGGVLDQLLQMKVKRFQRIHEGRMKDAPPHITRTYDLHELGLLAEELALIAPEAVAMGPNGPTGINLGYLVAMLIKAVQEINDRLPGR